MVIDNTGVLTSSDAGSATLDPCRAVKSKETGRRHTGHST